MAESMPSSERIVASRWSSKYRLLRARLDRCFKIEKPPPSRGGGAGRRGLTYLATMEASQLRCNRPKHIHESGRAGEAAPDNPILPRLCLATVEAGTLCGETHTKSPAEPRGSVRSTIRNLAPGYYPGVKSEPNKVISGPNIARRRPRPNFSAISRAHSKWAAN